MALYRSMDLQIKPDVSMCERALTSVLVVAEVSLGSIRATCQKLGIKFS